jgi:hypothetical protein
MLEPETEIEMTKGYKGEKGTIVERTESEFEFYVLKLDNGIQLVAGPTAFVPLEKGQGPAD